MTAINPLINSYRSYGLSGKPSTEEHLCVVKLLPYSRHILSMSRRYGVPPDLIYARIHIESGGNPNAVSRVGAIGLMQLMPATFRHIQDMMIKRFSHDAKRINKLSIYNPLHNIEVGTFYSAHLLKVYQHLNTRPEKLGDLLATLAYNMGPGTLQQYLDEFRGNKRNNMGEFISAYLSGALFNPKIQTKSNYIQSAKYIQKSLYYESKYKSVYPPPTKKRPPNRFYLS